MLAYDGLLKGCARCLTQDSNESLHSVIWSKCSKETSAKSRSVNIAVFEAVSEYNFCTLKALKEIQKAANLDLARRRFVEWAQNVIAVVPDFHKRILFSDEAHFWLNDFVNKQNCRIWSEANPQVYVETPLHPEKLTVWCALRAGRILLQKR
ncbi:hypothetical protein TNCV_1965351 [Trichonephila clavipes]|nr:hypothetical protein TNCV_1965351 [Trichonephila clavipes]